jgi:alpha-galactosidase
LELLLEACIYDSHAFLLLRCGIRNGGAAEQRVAALVPLASGQRGLRLERARQRSRFYRHGWQSWTPSLALSLHQRDIDATPPMHAPAAPPRDRGSFASEEVGVLFDTTSRQAFLTGFVTAHRDWTQVRLAAGSGAIEAVSVLDHKRLREGETLWSERLLVDLSDGDAMLGAYAEALAREMEARVPAPAPSGWCSWYYFFTGVTEADVRRNLRALTDRRRALPITHVQIDDGYQRDIGDWLETNETFPSGMAALADEIHDAGYEAGIWLAPFIVGERSQLFADHEEWVVRDDGGEPAVALQNWGQRCYALDCTNPDVQVWLRSLFKEITSGWGYDYVKIDFLYAGAIAGRRYQRDASRIEAYRQGLGTIREAVGDRFVLGCGALMGASAGLVDGQRVGPDVAPWWRFNRPLEPPREMGRPRAGGEPSVENALRNVLTRSWLHGRLWLNDPDCLLVREQRTKLSLTQVRSLATAIALSGGMVLLSDEIAELTEERLDIASLLLPALGAAADVPGLLGESMPMTMLLEVERPFESWYLLGCFNWQGRRRDLDIALPEGRWLAFELWEGRMLSVSGKRLILKDVPGHGCRLVALRRRLDHPQLAGTTLHYSMGGREVTSADYRESGQTLGLQLAPVAKRCGDVVVRVPPGYRCSEARLNGNPVDVRVPQRGVIAAPVTLDEPGELTIRFERRPA